MLRTIVLIGLLVAVWERFSFGAKTHYVNLNVFGRRLAIPRSRGIAVVGYIDSIAEKVRSMSLDKLDFTGGAVCISSRHHWEECRNRDMELPSTPTSGPIQPTRNKSNLRRAYQLGTKAVKKVPEYALVGALVLIGTELVKREVNRQTTFLPPVLKDLANKTLAELDNKLDTLMQLEFDVSPFITSEFNILRTQPADLIEKFVNTEIVNKLDTVVPNILAVFISDQSVVRTVSSKVLDLVRLLALVVIKRDVSRKASSINEPPSRSFTARWRAYFTGESISNSTSVLPLTTVADTYLIAEAGALPSGVQNSVRALKDELSSDADANNVRRAVDDLWEAVTAQGLSDKFVESLRSGSAALDKLWPALQIQEMSVKGTRWNPALDMLNKLFDIYKDDDPNM